nr:serine/threonine protein kinase [Burkholderiaceae bacterium]
MSSPPPDTPRPNAATSTAGAAWEATQVMPRPSPGRGNALPTGAHLAEFELLRVLGEGGFGIVYLAHDHSLQRRVAIKEYMPSSLAMRSGPLDVVVTADKNQAVFDAGLDSFINEARLLAQFDHPSLLKVYRFWRANGTAYMVMPFYEGHTLKETLRQMGNPPDERWLTALLASLTEALAVIHAEHCLHRDIAPDNVLLLADSGRPLLLDFGAARQVIGDATQALTAILKPGYAPVEQYAEVPSLKQGPWTDIYALCAVVYAAIMGSKPPVSVARTVADSCVPLVQAAAGRYSERFLQAIDAGLRVRPDGRPQSVQAFRQALGINDLPAGAVPMPTLPTPAGQAASGAALSSAAPTAPARPLPMPQAGGMSRTTAMAAA